MTYWRTFTLFNGVLWYWNSIGCLSPENTCQTERGVRWFLKSFWYVSGPLSIKSSVVQTGGRWEKNQMMINFISAIYAKSLQCLEDKLWMWNLSTHGTKVIMCHNNKLCFKTLMCFFFVIFFLKEISVLLFHAPCWRTLHWHRQVSLLYIAVCCCWCVNLSSYLTACSFTFLL